MCKFKFGDRIYYFKRNKYNGIFISKGGFLNYFVTKHDNKIYTCHPEIKDKKIIISNISLLDGITVIEDIKIDKEYEISYIKSCLLNFILNKKTIRKIFWDYIETTNLPNWFQNLRFDSLNSDTHIIVIWKRIRKRTREYKKPIFTFSLLLALSLLITLFTELYPQILENFYYRYIMTFLTLITFIGVFRPLSFRKEATK